MWTTLGKMFSAHYLHPANRKCRRVASSGSVFSEAEFLPKVVMVVVVVPVLPPWPGVWWGGAEHVVEVKVRC